MRRIISFLVVTIGVVFVLFGCSSDKKLTTLVSIDSGVIEGYTNASRAIKIFKGIPFAAPPIGNFRWKPPQPVKPWEGTLKCKNYGPSAVQPEPGPKKCWAEEYFVPKEPMGEDCLYLNVWSGAISTQEKRPVLVYIHGGAFRSGGSACPIFDGLSMAEKGVVLVNFNYRLGKFGFMAHPELTKESEHNASGNYGLMDMIEALNWVKKNIAAFGGDPENVTIAGESAGAAAINYLLSSPLTNGLFQKAIVESGAMFYWEQVNKKSLLLKNAESEGVRFASSLNCENIAEMRAKPAEDILRATKGPITPIIDNYVIDETLAEIYKQSKEKHIPIILGWNKDDDLEGGPITASEFKSKLKNKFGKLSEAFLKEYPANTDEEAAQSRTYLNRDEAFGIVSYSWAKAHANEGKSKIFVYNFYRDLPGRSADKDYGAFHAGEIPYAYNNLKILNRPWTPKDFKIADTMSDFWVNFAKSGNPNGLGLPQWDAFNPVGEKVMVFDTITESKPLPTKNKMLLWEKYYNSNTVSNN